VPLYELLVHYGIVPDLVTARHVKTVPGRKSDWNDAQWRKHAARAWLAPRRVST
jgi:hypothetical protein